MQDQAIIPAHDSGPPSRRAAKNKLRLPLGEPAPAEGLAPDLGVRRLPDLDGGVSPHCNIIYIILAHEVGIAESRVIIIIIM